MAEAPPSYEHVFEVPDVNKRPVCLNVMPQIFLVHLYSFSPVLCAEILRAVKVLVWVYPRLLHLKQLLESNLQVKKLQTVIKLQKTYQPVSITLVCYSCTYNAFLNEAIFILEWFGGYGSKKEHPLYRTTNTDYGKLPPTVHTMPVVFRPMTQTFSEVCFFYPIIFLSIMKR